MTVVSLKDPNNFDNVNFKVRFFVKQSFKWSMKPFVVSNPQTLASEVE